MRLTFLGTGTSFGVPQIGCDCAVCRSADPRDKRGRTSAVIHDRLDDRVYLIDTATELRAQALAVGLARVDAVLITHARADHTGGDPPERWRQSGGTGGPAASGADRGGGGGREGSTRPGRAGRLER